jgi:L-xylulokinase
MAGKKYYMGLDNGGTSCKAVLFDECGNELCHAGRMLKMITPAPLQTERNMDELWQKNIECIRETLQKSAVDVKLIKGIACCGHGKGLYLWGKNDRPVRNGIVSTDGRAIDYVKQWNQNGTARKVFKRNYQSILASQPVALLRWIKDHESGNYKNIKWVFEVKDYIRFMLTGEPFAEITDYSGSNLLDMTTNTFNKEILEWFGIPEMFHCLPPLKKSVDICGYISKKVAALTGLPEGIPVAGGMFDIDACCIATNVTDSKNLCVIAGTWSINEFITKKPILNHSVMMNSRYCLDDYYLVEECSPTSAGNLEWYIQMFCGKEKEAAEKQGTSIYHYCDELAASVEPENQDIIFLPYIFGSNYNPAAKACFLGIDSHHTQAHIVRAVFEGIVFCHMVHIEKLLQNRTDFEAIRLSGGAANSPVWTQMFADVTGYPVEVVNAKELGALGCAMAAAVACGEQPDMKTASEKMTKIGTIVYPTEKTQIYRRKFERYKAVSADLEKFWS